MSDFDNYSQDICWYVAHTYSGYENKVCANIQKIIDNRADMKGKITQVLIPVITHKEKDEDGKEIDVEEKVYPSYVLVKMVMSDETWHVIRNIRGVTGFVGPGSRPVALTDEEVKAIGIAEEKAPLAFEPGDSVKVVAGMLKDHIATVNSISEDGKTIKAVTLLFNRETVVELAVSDVEKLG
ncbi:MAG: transcription termination/antitermination protein NusG [Clostridiales bacterium]|nr:transcription termination/antitermination protein NusG [Clostridiales bacterium]